MFFRLLLLVFLSYGCSLRGQAGDQAEEAELLDEGEVEEVEMEAAELAAGEKEYWEAILQLNKSDELSQEAGRNLLMLGAEKEFPPAQNLLGGCYQDGTYGFPEKARKAVEYFQLAAERGYGFAQVNIGRCFLGGMGVRKDEDKALYWLTKAVEETGAFDERAPPDWYFEAIDMRVEEAEIDGQVGIPQAPPKVASEMLAHYLIALIYEMKGYKGFAQEHHLKAAYAGINDAFGIPEAATYAAINFAFGTGVERNMDKATELLERSQILTEQRYSLFASNLPSASLSNRFTRAKYTEFYNQVAKEQKEKLQYIFATVFDEADGDYTEAAKWYEIAANESQSAWAMLNLAFLYKDGKLRENPEVMMAHWFKRAAEEGNHYLGKSNYALCLYHGIGLPEDREAAMVIFNEIKEDDITGYLATIGQVAENIQSYDEKVEVNRYWANKVKDPNAQYLYGLRFKFGWGVTQTYVNANKYFKKAAKQGHLKATYELGISYNLGYQYSVNYKKALVYFEKAFELGYRSAGTYLAYYAKNRKMPSRLYLVEAGPRSKDPIEQAIFFYEQAIEDDSTDAMAWNNLGLIYAEEAEAIFKSGANEGYDELIRLALEHYERAAAEGNEKSYYNLGVLYYNGELVEQDFTKAYRNFFQAYELNHNYAAYYLGQMHWRGEGVNQSMEEAIHYFRVTASDRNIAMSKRREALHILANYYLGFQGESADVNAAQYWLLEYGKLGNIDAINKFGDLLLNKKEYVRARKYFKRIYKTDYAQVSSHAYYRLFQLYQNGLGGRANLRLAKKYLDRAIELNEPLALCDQGNQAHVQKDFQEAFRCWTLASDNSSAEAAYNLGCYYHTGTACAKDMGKAQALFRKAAGLGSRDGAYALGLLGYKEIPDGPTLEEALDFAEKALNWGHPEAQKLIDKIEKKLEGKRHREEDEGEKRGTGRVDVA